MESIKGKEVILMGATGGIGKQAAKMLAGSGARLTIAGRNSERLEALRAELKLEPERAIVADITSEADISNLSTSFHGYAQAADILIILSGIGIIKPMETLTPDDFRKTLETNLTGPFLMMKYFLPAMKEQKKGLIINIPGVLGKVPMAGAAAYSASKYGLTGMMQSIREELKRTEIRITNIFMGGVDSPFWDNIDLRVQREKMIREEEAAKAIWFLAQQPASGVVSEMVLQPFNHQAI